VGFYCSSLSGCEPGVSFALVIASLNKHVILCAVTLVLFVSLY